MIEGFGPLTTKSRSLIRRATASARASLEPVAWMLGGLALNMGIRAAWLAVGLHLPSWAGLFLDMVGLAVVGLARGPVAATGVVALDQIYRLVLGQISNPFVLVELAGALWWGWVARRPGTSFSPSRPLPLVRTFLLAAAGGGIVCGTAAWGVNLILGGTFRWMTVQNALYSRFDLAHVLRAFPIEILLSLWDKALTVALACIVLAVLARAGRRIPPLAPSWHRYLRLYRPTLTAALALTLTWGGFLIAFFLRQMLTVPLASNVRLYRLALSVGFTYLLLAAYLVLILILRGKATLRPVTFALGWGATCVGLLLFFLLGLYTAAHLLTWSADRTIWSAETAMFRALEADPKAPLPSGLARADGAAALRDLGLRFVARAAATDIPIWGGDADEKLRVIYPSDRSEAAPSSGFLTGSVTTYLAVQGRLGGPSGPTVTLYQEAPWLFNYGNAEQMFPALVLFFLLSGLILVLLFVLGRQMLRVTAEATLGRRARALAVRVRARNAELEEAARELEAMAALRERQVQELSGLAEVGKAAAVLAHEIRNPVAALQMAFGNFIESLGESPEGDLRDQAAIIERQIRHMNVLTQSVLSFSRSGTAVPGTDACSVRKVLETAAGLFGPVAKHHGVGLAMEAPLQDFAIAARESEVVQILQNLVLNAVEALGQAGRTDGRVVVAAAPLGTECVVTVSDNGPGIAEPDLDHIFDLFYSKRAEGTGVGLFIARKLARALQGELSVESEVGCGTTFVLCLPAAP